MWITCLSVTGWGALFFPVTVRVLDSGSPFKYERLFPDGQIFPIICLASGGLLFFPPCLTGLLAGNFHKARAGTGDGMKSTIKLGATRSIIIQPLPNGARIDITLGGVVVAGDNITPDQAGAIIFSLSTMVEPNGPMDFETWMAIQQGDPEEIGLMQALRIAYIAGQDSVARQTWSKVGAEL